MSLLERNTKNKEKKIKTKEIEFYGINQQK